MKTIVFFGSARKNGHTKQMLDLFCKHLDGEVEIMDCYRQQNIAPCKDCRHCWKVRACPIKDDMQQWYSKIDAAENIVIATPMYFHSLPGPMKMIMDRLQMYWAGRLRGDRKTGSAKRGALLMVGGAPSFEQQFLGGQIVAEGILADLQAKCLGIVCMPNSDCDSLATRPDLAEQVIALANRMNQAT